MVLLSSKGDRKAVLLELSEPCTVSGKGADGQRENFALPSRMAQSSTIVKTNG